MFLFYFPLNFLSVKVLFHWWVNSRLTELEVLLQSHDSCLEISIRLPESGDFVLKLGILILEPSVFILELGILVSDLDEAFSKLKVLFKDLINGGVLRVHDLVHFVPLKVCLRRRSEVPALIDAITIIVHLNRLLFFAQISALCHCLRLLS